MVGDPALKPIASLLLEMNTIKRGLADAELDYDRALKAIDNFTTEFLEQDAGLSHCQPVVYSLLFMLGSSEYALRLSALQALKVFVRMQFVNAGEEGKTHEGNKFVRDQLLGLWREAVKKESDELIQKSLYELLREIVLCRKQCMKDSKAT